MCVSGVVLVAGLCVWFVRVELPWFRVFWDGCWGGGEFL
jgi:hypothetical protein